VTRGKLTLIIEKSFFVVSLSGLFLLSGLAISGPQIELMSQLQALTLSFEDGLWRCFNLFGHFLGAAFIVLMISRRAIFVFALGIASISGSILIRLLKVAFNEPRPAALMHENLHIIGEALGHYSMPSGHSMTIAIVFGLLLSLSQKLSTSATLVRFPIIGLVIGVGLARIASGAHWPADVLVGIGLGILIGFWSGRVSLSLARKLPPLYWLNPLSRFLLALALILTPLPPSCSTGTAIVLALTLAAWELFQQQFTDSSKSQFLQ